MTDRIDLDDLDVDGEADDDGPNRGDWFWRGEGDPEAEPGDDDAWTERVRSDDGDGSGSTDDRDRGPAPRVPRETDGAPVGIPVDRAGAGAGAVDESRETPARTGHPGGVSAGDDEEGRAQHPDAGTTASTGDATAADAGPGADADDMTMAFTYGAISRLEDPAAAVGDAEGTEVGTTWQRGLLIGAVVLFLLAMVGLFAT